MVVVVLLLLLLLLAVGGVCFKLGQLSAISIVDKERPFSCGAVLLLLLLLLALLLLLLAVVVLCVLNKGNSPQFQLLIRNVHLATRRCCC